MMYECETCGFTAGPKEINWHMLRTNHEGYFSLGADE